MPIVVNANGDGRPDLFTGQEEVNDFTSLNRLWTATGSTTSSCRRVHITNGKGNRCAAADDIDGDGLDEIAMCTTKRGIFVYRNEDGKYVEDTRSFGLDPYGRINLEFAGHEWRRPARPHHGHPYRCPRVFLNQHASLTPTPSGASRCHRRAGHRRRRHRR